MSDAQNQQDSVSNLVPSRLQMSERHQEISLQPASILEFGLGQNRRSILPFIFAVVSSMLIPSLLATPASAQTPGDEAGILVGDPSAAPASPTEDVAIPFETEPPSSAAPTSAAPTSAAAPSDEIPFENPSAAPVLPTTAPTKKVYKNTQGTRPGATPPLAPNANSAGNSPGVSAGLSPVDAQATGSDGAAKGKAPTLFINTLPAGSENKVFEESSLTTGKRKNPDFTVPLLFAPEDNGFELGRPQIRWDLRNGKDAILTGLRVRSSGIGFAMTQTPRKSQGVLSTLFSGHDDRPFVTNISFRWPQIFATTGTFTLEDTAGKTVYSQAVTASTHAQWNSYLHSSGAKSMPDSLIHTGSNWGLADIDPQEFSFLFKRSQLRACLSKTLEQDQSLKICSGTFSLTPFKDGHVTQTGTAEVKPTAMLEGKEIGDRGLINFPDGKKINFGIRFANGASIQISSQPIHLKIYDVIESASGRTVLLTGEGAQPVGRVKMLKVPDLHFWSGTIIKQERVWQLAISKEAPIVKVLGSFNMPFDLLFDAKRLPKEADRAYIAERQTQTYIREPFMYGTASPDLKIESSETRVRKLSASNFRWRFLAEKENETNKARIKLTEKDGTQWVAHYDVYRAPASEFAGHFTGVLSSDGQAVAMGEVMAIHWFESLGFTDNKRLALQHWGIDARYFRAFSSFQLSEGVVVNNYDQLSMNLRYNLNHGIWNRDEIVGLMLSGQHLNFSTLSATVLGPGIYWGRTMPKIVDDAFNLIPGLRYPKYLEIEFSYLPFSISSKTKAGPTYNLNFRGKCFWTPEFFGEAGFGVKQLDFVDNGQAQEAAFTTAYGLVGLGLLF